MNLNPSKIVCAGLNYLDHAKEMKMEIPSHPIIFLKSPSSIIYDNDYIIYPEQTNELHYEAELAIIIKDKTRNVSESEASSHILGFTCANDVTARDLQRLDGQWGRAKSFDTFCPIGPKIVSDVNPDNLEIKAILNGKVVQKSRTSQMIFKPMFLVSFISKIMTLLPGDVILTGTPAGIGPMQKGDKIVIEIEGIGLLTNMVR